jgi:predicted PurR-regulated permease PerM
MLSRFRIPLLACVVAIYFFAFVTSPAIAGLVGSIGSPEFDSAGTRTDEIVKIQLALENEMVKAKLTAFGLTSEEVQQKLQDMDDQQISLLAQASEDVLAGGDGLGIVIGVLLIILLVIVILKLMNKSVVVK